MFKNFLKIAVRNLLKQKGYSLINTFGLAVGLTSCLLIFLYVMDELSFDRFHEKADSVYRMNWDFNYRNNEGISPGSPPPLAAALVGEIPQIEAATRLYAVSDMVVRYENKFFTEKNILAADRNFFEFFSFNLIEGDKANALKDPNSVILTRDMAQKYFGVEPAVGKLITIGDKTKFFDRTYTDVFKVTGVVENVPANSHLQFDFLTSMASHPEMLYFNWSWFWMQVATYTIVDGQADLPTLESKVTEVVAGNAPGAFKRLGLSYDELITSGGRWNFVFEPMTDIYLGDIGNRLGPKGSKDNIVLFSIIAIFILFVACINFINLSTARSANRAHEVGVRKVLGSVKKNLMWQFLAESVIFSLVATFLALGFTELMIDSFNLWTGKSLQIDFFDKFWLLPSVILLALFVGIIAGSYPALYLSKFQPVEVLRGKLSITKGKGLRNSLVVFQFAVSIALLICTIVVDRQMTFLQGADIGFDKEDILIITNDNHRLGSNADTFVERIKTYPEVINATISTGVPPQYGFQDFYRAKKESDDKIDLISYMTDEDFLATLGIEVVQGRGFAKDFNESQSIILNQTALDKFGLDEEDAVGKKIYYYKREYNITGIVRDFNFLALQQPIPAFALFHESSKSYQIPNSSIAVRFRPDALETTLHKLKEEWQTLSPATPFEYSFLDENFQAHYSSTRRFGTLFFVFTSLAIFIACLGLLGLASFTAQKRTSEIGIRKVLGASVPGLVFMLSREFTRWVALANILAWPVAFYLMTSWLRGFAYRTSITWDIFLIAGGTAFVISILTVAFQAIKAAFADPVESLRYE